MEVCTKRRLNRPHSKQSGTFFRNMSQNQLFLIISKCEQECSDMYPIPYFLFFVFYFLYFLYFTFCISCQVNTFHFLNLHPSPQLLSGDISSAPLNGKYL